VLIDATGSERNVLQKKKYNKHLAMAATGIEYHVEVSSDLFSKYDQTLSFYIGHKWMPQGYAWIFPIKADQLKIGIVRYFSHETLVPHEPSMDYYINKLIENCFGSKCGKILEKHGKTIHYTYGQKDLLYHDNLIAIGDAISTLNPLGAEGIRHAMKSGTIAANQIVNFLENGNSFHDYSKAMKKYFGFKWKISELIMNTFYREKDDHRIDLYLKTFKHSSFEELLDLGFSYQLRKAIKFYLILNVLKLSEKLKF
jgi:digeranylgeranylglycerophospholipid reductase